MSTYNIMDNSFLEVSQNNVINYLIVNLLYTFHTFAG